MTFVDVVLIVAIFILLAWNIALTVGVPIVQTASARRLIRELAADLPKVTSVASEASHLPDAVTRKTRELLRARALRLVRVLDLDAPNFIVAWQAAMVGDAAWMLDPWAVADRLTEKHAAEARWYAGICAEAPCEGAAVEDGLCADHAAKLRSDTDLEVEAS